jgi:hypothetical protein
VWVSVYTSGGNGTGCLGLPSDALDEAPASPFIASKQKARVTTVVVNDRGKEERKKTRWFQESSSLSSSGLGLRPCGT